MDPEIIEGAAPTPAPAPVNQEVVPPAPAPAEGQTTPVEGEIQEQPRDSNGKFKGVQSRIDELTAARRQAEREAAYWRGIADARSAPAQSPAPVAAPPQKPNREQYETYDDYVEALAEFKAKQLVGEALKSDREAREQAETSRKNQEVATKKATTFGERLAATRVEFPDFDEVVGNSPVVILPALQAEIEDSEHGPKLARHLALHPEVADKLNSLDQRSLTREVARMEVTLFGPTSAPAPTPGAAPAPTSIERPAPKAPTPVTPVKAGSGAPIVDLNKASMDEYVKTRKAQGASWAR